MGKKKSKKKDNRLSDAKLPAIGSQPIPAQKAADQDSGSNSPLVDGLGEVGIAVATAVLGALAQRAVSTATRSLAKSDTASNFAGSVNSSANTTSSAIQEILHELKPVLLQLIDAIRDAIENFDASEALTTVKGGIEKAKDAVEDTIQNVSTAVKETAQDSQEKVADAVDQGNATRNSLTQVAGVAAEAIASVLQDAKTKKESDRPVSHSINDDD
jgi:hypothetical protein